MLAHVGVSEKNCFTVVKELETACETWSKTAPLKLGQFVIQSVVKHIALVIRWYVDEPIEN
jgi:hypothetical protein